MEWSKCVDRFEHVFGSTKSLFSSIFSSLTLSSSTCHLHGPCQEKSPTFGCAASHICCITLFHRLWTTWRRQPPPLHLPKCNQKFKSSWRTSSPDMLRISFLPFGHVGLGLQIWGERFHGFSIRKNISKVCALITIFVRGLKVFGSFDGKVPLFSGAMIYVRCFVQKSTPENQNLRRDLFS